MMTLAQESVQNFILKFLPDAVYEKIAVILEMVEMPHAMPIYRSYEKIEYVYFPETSVISVVTCLENGNSVETGIIGKDGLSRIETILGAESSSRGAMIQLAGAGYRMKVKDFQVLFNGEKSFARLVMRYIYSFMEQMSHNQACLCFHNIEKRLARWLLMFQDRGGRSELFLTQEFIAIMLGVHRPSVSKTAAKLQNMNLIGYIRGKIKILDRPGLLQTSAKVMKRFVISQVSLINPSYY